MTEHNKIETFVIMSKENEQERYNIFKTGVTIQITRIFKYTLF